MVNSISHRLESAGDFLLAPAKWSGRTVVHLFDVPKDCFEPFARVAKLALILFGSPFIMAAGAIGGVLKGVSWLLPANPEEFHTPSEDIEAIELNVEALINAGPDQSKEQIAQLKGQIKAFSDKNPGEIKKVALLQSLVDAIERSAKTWELEQNYRRQYATVREFRIDDGGVVHVPDDGNCAYHAAGLLLKSCGFDVDHKELRKKVYEYLGQHQNDALLFGYLDDAFNAYNEDLENSCKEAISNYDFFKAQKEIDQEQYEALIAKDNAEMNSKRMDTIKDYIEKVGQEGFWAGLPELYAIGMIYNIQFQVENTPHGTITIPSDLSAPKAAPLTLVYNWSRNNPGSHYNCRFPDSQK